MLAGFSPSSAIRRLSRMVTDTSASSLIKELVELSSKQRKLVRSSKYAAPADPAISITSWKMNEVKYYTVPSPFPTYARGIFSTEQNGEHRIVARGYDKFFNIGEVGWCTWPAIEAHTAAPYTLSLKSNGCIIFIAALSPDKLLVTSKHSLGPTNTHAVTGERWLRKYLEQKGRSEADLAAVLWKNNWTAISELCDDSFEEHVLAYPPELTGLHLHGLNENTRAFKTLPQADVDAFADEWGFIKTASVELSSVAQVREFADECSKTGSWNGQPVEGFVVRTQVAPAPPESSPRSTPPYPPGSNFFFKIKYEEPYLKYRDWREITKMLLSMRQGNANQTNDGMSLEKLPKQKLRREETQAYAKWVIEEIRRDPEAFAEYANNKGIIAIRERFLAFAQTDDGKKSVQEVVKPVKDFGKTVILPVAIPGCGKTMLSLALSRLFGFGHTQSDDVHVKKAAPIFLKNVVDLLNTNDVVIADKNNHLVQHRQALREATAEFDPPVRLLALNWAMDKYAPATVHRICSDRVQGRGSNHQTLRPDSAKSHEDILWMFITKAEPLAPAEVDEVVEMNLEDGLEEAVARAVEACVRVLGVAPPDQAAVHEAIEYARSYTPAVKKPDLLPSKKDKDAKKPRYFALLPEVSVETTLKNVEALAQVKFWTRIRQEKRIAARPHITIVHQNSIGSQSSGDAQALWERCKRLSEMEQPPLFQFKLGHVVWNDRVMAVTVDDIELVEEGGEGHHGAEFVAGLEDELKQRLHVTVGTRDPNVPPVEAKAMVAQWRTNGASAKSAPLNGVIGVGRVKRMTV
ncbi:tRNA ligase [Mycena indigotica]|uniref:tRNA ligase n=1 Tax=Mycena indigotica TaxID=2126181 RepID=A0A8H6SGR8_9AGAR|nr:tRNA ligase [Mycena indigotica]KAF7299196.1 tRNA ligase [Mycena indigotica]